MAKNDDSFDDDAIAVEDAPLFTAKEIAEIKAAARDEVLKDKKAAAKKKMMADEKQRLQREEGFTTGNSHADEIVTVYVNLAPYAPHILVNGHAYWHGQSYPVPRHVAASLQETMFHTWKHQSAIRGESLSEFYANKHVTDVWAVGKGGPSLATFSARGK